MPESYSMYWGRRGCPVPKSKKHLLHVCRHSNITKLQKIEKKTIGILLFEVRVIGRKKIRRNRTIYQNFSLEMSFNRIERINNFQFWHFWHEKLYVSFHSCLPPESMLFLFNNSASPLKPWQRQQTKIRCFISNFPNSWSFKIIIQLKCFMKVAIYGH